MEPKATECARLVVLLRTVTCVLLLLTVVGCVKTPNALWISTDDANLKKVGSRKAQDDLSFCQTMARQTLFERFSDGEFQIWHMDPYFMTYLEKQIAEGVPPVLPIHKGDTVAGIKPLTGASLSTSTLTKDSVVTVAEQASLPLTEAAGAAMYGQKFADAIQTGSTMFGSVPYAGAGLLGASLILEASAFAVGKFAPDQLPEYQPFYYRKPMTAVYKESVSSCLLARGYNSGVGKAE